MAASRHPGNQIVKDELAKSGSADSRTIARKLCKLYPSIWPTVDKARDAVRYVRGARGSKNRRLMAKGSTIPRIELPDPDDGEAKDYALPNTASKWLILSDVHIPYHAKPELQLALDFGAEQGCDGVLINGDFLDFCSLSFFEKDPRIRNFAGEIDTAKRVLDSMQSVLQPKAVLYKGGNHEHRLARYLMERVPEVFEELDKHFSMDTVLGLTARGIQWISDRDLIRHGKLTVVHGHEFGNRFSSPVNPARGAFLKAHSCVIQGHEHKTSDHTERTLDGVAISCWSTGCLCHLRPKWRPVNSWNHGFATLDTAGEKWSIRNYRIIDGVVA